MSTHHVASSKSFVDNGHALFFGEHGRRTTAVRLDPEQAVEHARVPNRQYEGAPYEDLAPRRVQALPVTAAALSPSGVPADFLPLAEWLLIDAPAGLA